LRRPGQNPRRAVERSLAWVVCGAALEAAVHVGQVGASIGRAKDVRHEISSLS
jgi:hypothetical protein